MAYGTNSVLDTLRASQQSIAQYGEDLAFQQIQVALAAHNAQVREMITELAEMTTDRQRRYGGPDTMAFDESDEFGTPDAQKVVAGTTVGFPLRLYQVGIQWTRKYMQTASPQEMAAQFEAAQDGDVKNVIKQIKRAIYLPTNTTFLDRLVDNVSLSVKAFVNADSAGVPLGPNGETFTASSHTHYLYTAGASLAAADVIALVTAVVEHSAVGTPEIYINTAQETAFRALSGFTAITPTFVTPAYTSAAIVQDFNRTNVNNRLIGYFGTNYAEVWVKPWAQAGYLFAFMDGAPKPLAIRERTAGFGDLNIAAEDEDFPLRARTMERELGVGVWNRTNGAVLFVDAGSAGSYTAPTITA